VELVPNSSSFRRMRKPPGAVDGTGSVRAVNSGVGGGGGRRWTDRSNAGQNILIYGTGQIKNEATFFIVLIIMLFTVLVHSCRAR
jgi:hypothetical protein